MKSTKDSYTLALVACMIIFILATGVISILTTKKILRENAHNSLTLLCDNARIEFDRNIYSIEQSVDTLSSSAINHIHDFESFKTDDAHVNEYSESLRDILLYTAENTQGALSVYIRYNPEFTNPSSGLFFVKNSETGKFEETRVTDFSSSSSNETTWYDEPIAAGKPIWMNPYTNNTIGYSMISYVVPLYYDNEVFGVIGMDIDYEYIHKLITNYSAYDSGYAFLITEEGKIVVHKDYKMNSDFPNEKIKENLFRVLDSNNNSGQYELSDNTKTFVCMKTANGMVLCITAPDNEIYSAYYTLVYNLVILTLSALAITTLISSFIVRRIFKYSEIDELTGISNRKHFINEFKTLDDNKKATHSLFIFDIDFFKQVNDTYGHNAGDQAIEMVAKKSVKILGKEALLARWGGDEFIGLIKSSEASKKLESLRKEINSENNEVFGNISLSIGAAQIGTGSTLIEACEKADNALYHSKSEGRNRVTITK